MKYLNCFYLDKEKDIIISLYTEKNQMFYTLRTPNHGTGNLITNLAGMFNLPLTFDENGLKIIKGTVPSYYDGSDRLVYILHFGKTKVANIYPDGTVERKASIPAIAKTLMSQTKDYHLDYEKTIVKTYIRSDCKFRSDLHTHMNANLEPDVLIALGICHQIEYPLYYIKKLSLRITEKQQKKLEEKREKISLSIPCMQGNDRHRDRKIDDQVVINFADLILNNIENAEWNIPKIRASLAVMKDGQAVFTNLEKVYLYRYVFTKGKESKKKISLRNAGRIPDCDIARFIRMMQNDQRNSVYANQSLFRDILLWTARTYQKHGIYYVEISDTTLVKKDKALDMLKDVHAIMPAVYKETGVMIRFLASLRRIPLTIVKDSITGADYRDNLQTVQTVSCDPYVAGSDIVGEEINDIRELKPVIQELTGIAEKEKSFVIRIHAGENDGLKDNVYNSIQCVVDSLKPGQSMPHMRIGHGLYTANLNSTKGRELISYILDHHVVLEFQITSNVRLNNLNSLEKHPLKQYLKAGILCVQGTDGGALYGTDSIDEQLALEKMLDLNSDEILQMKHAENTVIEEGMHAYHDKEQKLKKMLKNKTLDQLYSERMSEAEKSMKNLLFSSKQYCSSTVFVKNIESLPAAGMPVIIAGGSYNNDSHRTCMHDDDRRVIDTILKKADPRKVFFVIGSRFTGSEKYLLDKNQGRFRVYAFVPAAVDEKDMKKIKQQDVKIRVSIESSVMGLYKSVNFEILKRRPSVLIAFDGNSAGMNLIQEAKLNRKCRIFISEHARFLKSKAESIEGYVTLFSSPAITGEMMKWISGEKKFKKKAAVI